MGLQDQLGVIKPGARAWLLGLKQNPLHDPLSLAEPVWRTF